MKNLIVIVVLAAVVALPFLFRKEAPVRQDIDAQLVVVSPHNEFIRREFGRGFSEWYKERTGEVVAVDWRVPGGTSEITRYINSEYINAFRNYWEGELGREWSAEVQGAFNNRKLDPNDDAASPEKRDARKAFLESDVSSGIDVFFGGGSYDFGVQAAMGHLVDVGILEEHPEWFGEGGIPQEWRGEVFHDDQGRWIGAALSSFGIIYNTVVLEGLDIENPPSQWVDLADPRFIGQLGVADPTKSGSITKAFEMIVQVEMQRELAELEASGLSVDEREAVALEAGWLEGMRVIQRVAANARYFTDSATKPPLDVAAGDCAAGMSIDFYGRFQNEALRERGASERFVYFTPVDGSTINADPIGVLRGAPHPELAKAFVEYVLSPEGQKLWNYRVGTEGGPRENALRRLPIRPDLYTPETSALRSDPGVNPYDPSLSFIYCGDWTGPLFGPLRFIIGRAFMDAHEELIGAWAALIENDFPPEATALFNDLSAMDFEQAGGRVSEALRGGPLEEIRLARELTEASRARYREVLALAEAGR